MVNDGKITLEKPSKVIENMTGFPYNRIVQEISRSAKKERQQSVRLLLSAFHDY